MSDVNDYVPRETFSHLDVEDLIVMADVCSTFQRVARKEFTSRYKKVNLRAEVSENTIEIVGGKSVRRGKKGNFSVWFRYLTVARSHWISVLRNFGSVITSLGVGSIREEYFERHLPPLQEIVKYCSKSLLELQLCKAEWTNEMILVWQPLLSRLRRFELRCCNFNSGADTSQLLSFCIELESLKVDRFSMFFSVRPMSLDRPVALPKLRSIHLYDSYLNNDDVERLIVLNPQLEAIELPSNTFDYGMIGTYVPDLKLMQLRWNRDVTSDWKKFRNLRSLYING